MDNIAKDECSLGDVSTAKNSEIHAEKDVTGGDLCNMKDKCGETTHLNENNGRGADGTRWKPGQLRLDVDVESDVCGHIPKGEQEKISKNTNVFDKNGGDSSQDSLSTGIITPDSMNQNSLGQGCAIKTSDDNEAFNKADKTIESSVSENDLGDKVNSNHKVNEKPSCSDKSSNENKILRNDLPSSSKSDIGSRDIISDASNRNSNERSQSIYSSNSDLDSIKQSENEMNDLDIQSTCSTGNLNMSRESIFYSDQSSECNNIMSSVVLKNIDNNSLCNLMIYTSEDSESDSSSSSGEEDDESDEADEEEEEETFDSESEEEDNARKK